MWVMVWVATRFSATSCGRSLRYRTWAILRGMKCLAVGQRQGRLEDADDLEVRLADPDRVADLGRVLAGQVSPEDDDVLTLVRRCQRPSRCVCVRELIAPAIGPGNVPDHLVGQADLMAQVIDHRLDLAVGHIDAVRRCRPGD